MNENKELNYPIGIWYLITDETGKIMAQKTYNNSSGIRQITVPVTKDILEEILKQINANKLFSAFQKLDINDEHIIGYLNLMLEDYINFLDSASLNNFIIKMEQIATSTKIDINNATSINALITSLKSNNIDSFMDTLEQFQAYNHESLAKPITFQETETVKQH